jgi:hypothetical protein
VEPSDARRGERGGSGRWRVSGPSMARSDVQPPGSVTSTLAPGRWWSGGAGGDGRMRVLGGPGMVLQ